MSVAVEEIVGFCLRVNARADDDRDDQAVDAQHSRHHNRHNRFHHQLRPHNAHGGNTDAALSRAVRRTHAGENEGRRGAQEAEEGSSFIAAEINHSFFPSLNFGFGQTRVRSVDITFIIAKIFPSLFPPSLLPSRKFLEPTLSATSVIITNAKLYYFSNN